MSGHMSSIVSGADKAPASAMSGAGATARRWALRTLAAAALAAVFSLYGHADVIVALAGSAWTCF